MNELIQFKVCEKHRHEPGKELQTCPSCTKMEKSLKDFISELSVTTSWQYLDLTKQSIRNFSDDIGRLICENKGIKYLCLNSNELGIDYDWYFNAKFWYTYMCANTTITVLEAQRCEMGCNIDARFFAECVFKNLYFIDLSENADFYSAKQFLEYLTTNKTVQGFSWRKNYIVGSDLPLMADLISKNTTIKYLNFQEVSQNEDKYVRDNKSKIDYEDYEEGWKQIAKSLWDNTTLLQLILTPNSRCSEKFGRSITVGLEFQTALSINSTLQKFRFNFDVGWKEKEYFGEEKLDELELNLNFGQ